MVVDRLVYLDAHLGKEEEAEEDKNQRIARDNLDAGMSEVMDYVVRNLDEEDGSNPHPLW